MNDPARGSYFHHFEFGLGGYADRVLVRVRQEVVEHFLATFAPEASDEILDVGVSADDHVSSNPLEKRWPHHDRMTAVGFADAREVALRWDAALAASKFADVEGFGLAPEGHITLQDHGDLVWYRNVKIRTPGR